MSVEFISLANVCGQMRRVAALSAPLG
jgi:hypothetical protein